MNYVNSFEDLALHEGIAVPEFISIHTFDGTPGKRAGLPPAPPPSSAIIDSTNRIRTIEAPNIRISLPTPL